MPDAPVAGAMRRRHSQPSVDARAPKRRELLRLIEAAGSVADHSALRPWRIIEIRGDARRRVGDALAAAAGIEGAAGEKLAGKPLRAPLLLAVVVCPKPSLKVPEWEQEAVAAGVAHALSLVLTEAGWGVMWRTGLHVRSEPVARVHRLEPGERLLGWLYVGGVAKPKRGKRTPIKAAEYLSSL